MQIVFQEAFPTNTKTGADSRDKVETGVSNEQKFSNKTLKTGTLLFSFRKFFHCKSTSVVVSVTSGVSLLGFSWTA